eukprot:Clim_evm28s144 gene=Clim_evmTU28s144
MALLGFECVIGEGTCAAGLFCEPESDPLGPEGICQQCLPGSFCPAGTDLRNGTVLSVLCAGGSYCPSLTDQLPCPAGHACPAGATPSAVTGGATEADGAPFEGASTYACVTTVVSPGNVCLEGSMQPMRCAEGSFCPLDPFYDDGNPAAGSGVLLAVPLPSVDSDDGNETQSQQDLPTQQIMRRQEICPEGFFCRAGTVDPRDCGSLQRCPEGSTTPSFPIIILVLIIAIIVTVKYLFRYLVRKPMDKRRVIVAGDLSDSRRGIYALDLVLEYFTGADLSRYTMRNRAMQVKDRPMTLRCRDVFLTVPDPNAKAAAKAATKQKTNGSSTTAPSKTKVIVNNVSVTLPAGAFTAIMGPSGCGKTSLMNVMCNRAQAYGQVMGQCEAVITHGQVARKLRSATLGRGQAEETVSMTTLTGRDIGFVPQDDTVHEYLTVRENLTYSARLRFRDQCGNHALDGLSLSRAAEANIKTLVEDTLLLLDLVDVADSYPGRPGGERGISGGQRKRLNVGLELVADPTLLFLDEPTTGLDSWTALMLTNSLKGIAQQTFTTVCAVVHQPALSSFMALDHVVILANGGRLAYEGPPALLEGWIRYLRLDMPEKENPADYFLDVLSGRSSGSNSSTLPSAETVNEQEMQSITQRRTSRGRTRRSQFDTFALVEEVLKEEEEGGDPREYRQRNMHNNGNGNYHRKHRADRAESMMMLEQPEDPKEYAVWVPTQWQRFRDQHNATSIRDQHNATSKSTAEMHKFLESHVSAATRPSSATTLGATMRRTMANAGRKRTLGRTQATAMFNGDFGPETVYQTLDRLGPRQTARLMQTQQTEAKRSIAINRNLWQGSQSKRTLWAILDEVSEDLASLGVNVDDEAVLVALADALGFNAGKVTIGADDMEEVLQKRLGQIDKEHPSGDDKNQVGDEMKKRKETDIESSAADDSVLDGAPNMDSSNGSQPRNHISASRNLVEWPLHLIWHLRQVLTAKIKALPRVETEVWGALIAGFILGMAFRFTPRADFLLSSLMLAVLMTLSSLKIFGDDKALIRRNAFAGQRMSALFLSRDLAYLFPEVTVVPLVYTAIWIAFVMPPGSVAQYYLIWLTMSYAATGYGYLISVLASPEVAKFVGLLLPVVMTFVLAGLEEPSRRDLQEANANFVLFPSYLRWAIEALLDTEASALPEFEREFVQQAQNDLTGFESGVALRNCGIMVVLGALMRFFAFLGLEYVSRLLPYGGLRKYVRQLKGKKKVEEHETVMDSDAVHDVEEKKMGLDGGSPPSSQVTLGSAGYPLPSGVSGSVIDVRDSTSSGATGTHGSDASLFGSKAPLVRSQGTLAGESVSPARPQPQQPRQAHNRRPETIQPHSVARQESDYYDRNAGMAAGSATGATIRSPGAYLMGTRGSIEEEDLFISENPLSNRRK